VFQDLDLAADFYDWVLSTLKADCAARKRILIFEAEDAAPLAPLLKEGISFDDLDRKALADTPDAAYDFILCPSLFLSLEKDATAAAARVLGRLLAPGGDAHVLFPPAWLPAAWADKVVKFHKEGNTKLYFRFKDHISAYTNYTNREIELLPSDLRLERLTILRDGFRRAHFTRRAMETA
jgi:hypothetical protein